MKETSGFGLTDTVDSCIAQPIYVGSGGTADCFRVNRHGKWLLMKRLKPEFASNERCRQALLKEFEIGISIDHPNIVRYQYVADSAEELYILQDYVDGLTLDKFVEQHPDYFHQTSHRKRFLDELLSAVACLHAHQVLHLDLNPSNIIITTQGQSVKLIDLGMALSDAFTSTYGGTKGYQAPETTSTNGEKPTASADIYSIGCIMKFIGSPRKSVIRRCLNTDARLRYQTVDELQHAINGRNRRWTVLLAIAVVLVAVFVLLLISRQKNNEKINIVPQLVATTTANDKPSVSNNTSTLHKERAENNNRYVAAMSEIRNSLNREKQRIYSSIDKKLAKPDLSERNLYDNSRNILITNSRELRAIERRLYDEKNVAMVTTPFADSVYNAYFTRLEQLNKALHEKDDEREATAKAQQQKLYDHIVGIIDDVYAPILQLVATPPNDKADFYKQFIALKEKANKAYAAALEQGYKQYGVTLSEKQNQQIGEKINQIEEKFYTKYNEK